MRKRTEPPDAVYMDMLGRAKGWSDRGLRWGAAWRRRRPGRHKPAARAALHAIGNEARHRGVVVEVAG